MPTNIRITRKCEYCGKEFEARKTTSRTCSQSCSSKAHRAREVEKKIGASNRQTRLQGDTVSQLAKIETVKAKEFLTVRDAALLLSSSRRTVYRMIETGAIPAVNLHVKKTLIRRSDINHVFAQPDVRPLCKATRPPLTLPLDECYTMLDVQEQLGISPKAAYEFLNRHDIPRQYAGRFAYVPKAPIDDYINTLTANHLHE